MIDLLFIVNVIVFGNKKGQNKSKKCVFIVELLEILFYCILVINVYEQENIGEILQIFCG